MKEVWTVDFRLWNVNWELGIRNCTAEPGNEDLFDALRHQEIRT